MSIQGRHRFSSLPVHAAPSTDGPEVRTCTHCGDRVAFRIDPLGIGPSVRSADTSTKVKRYGTVPAAEHSQVERPINEPRSQAKTGRQRRKR